MKSYLTAGVIFIAFFVLMLSEPSFAGPGGKIARATIETFWGRVGISILTIIFLPLICYMMLKELVAERRARRDLGFMANYSSSFEWLKIQERAKECFYRIHSGWDKEDLSIAASWMTDWYWQNQQQVHIERWKKEGLINICKVKKIKKIKPLLFVHRNHGSEHENSMVVMLIEANMIDFLQDRVSGKVVEGSKGYKNIETIWSLNLESREWKVSDIEEGSMSLSYARAGKYLPKIEKTVVSDLRA